MPSNNAEGLQPASTTDTDVVSACVSAHGTGSGTARGGFFFRKWALQASCAQAVLAKPFPWSRFEFLCVCVPAHVRAGPQLWAAAGSAVSFGCPPVRPFSPLLSEGQGYLLTQRGGVGSSC